MLLGLYTLSYTFTPLHRKYAFTLLHYKHAFTPLPRNYISIHSIVISIFLPEGLVHFR
jgi:hypothetical protein